ncbi:hypothetical protein [Nevskia soli]|uniref:hypothetical protein n=1 Tax=Nevskia soli TaxID=418856 RepID=UPI0004A6D55C|nr:hypothetical protein [Nevskia soli]
MKLRKRTILSAAFGIVVCTAVAHADQPRHGAVKAPAPVVVLPADTKRVIIPTPLGGPSVAVPVRSGIDVAAGAPSAAPVAMAPPQVPRAAPAPAPKVVMPVGSNVPPVRTREAGPIVNVSP